MHLTDTAHVTPHASDKEESPEFQPLSFDDVEIVPSHRLIDTLAYLVTESPTTYDIQGSPVPIILKFMRTEFGGGFMQPLNLAIANRLGREKDLPEKEKTPILLYFHPERMSSTDWQVAGNLANLGAQLLPIVRDTKIPLCGFDHTKGGVFGDELVFTGTNLEMELIDGFDYSLVIKNPRLAEIVRGWMLHPPTQDQKVSPYSNTTLLYDAGIRGRSVIMKNVQRLIEKSNGKILAALQLTPDRPIRETLAYKTACSRNGNVNVLVGNPDHIPSPGIRAVGRVNNFFAARDSLWVINVRWSMVPNRTFHPKIVLSDDGSQSFAYIGSHNLTLSSTKAGTVEMGLIVYDETFVKRLWREIYTTVNQRGFTRNLN